MTEEVTPEPTPHHWRTRAALKPLLDGFEKLIRSVGNTEIKEEVRHLADGQDLILKVYHHVRSIYALSEGFEISDPQGPRSLYIDYSSIAVLARAAFEAAVLFHFIFCARDRQLYRLRKDVWTLHSVKERLRLQGSDHVQEKAETYRENDRKLCDALVRRIERNPHYATLSKSVQHNAIKKGGIRLGHTWADLAANAGIPRAYAADLHNVLCEYTHSGAVSIYQMRDAAIDSGGTTYTGGILLFCIIVLTETIIHYAAQYDRANSTILDDLDLLTTVSQWHEWRRTIWQKYRRPME